MIKRFSSRRQQLGRSFLAEPPTVILLDCLNGVGSCDGWLSFRQDGAVSFQTPLLTILRRCP
ncbi:MAG: hypothetical protein DVB23_002845 [Verrucomicrobia bacterium]|nr:MAG: hypothetical protein DVB23_002845 [Verrucomicrobiota bacterium]